MEIDLPHHAKVEIHETKSLHVVFLYKQLKPIDEVDKEESKCVVKKHCTMLDSQEEVWIMAYILPGAKDPVVYPKWSTTPEVDPDGN